MYNLEILFNSKTILIPLLGYMNGNQDYQRAKTPIRSFQNYPGLTEEEAGDHIKKGGWLGLVIPENYILVDIDNKRVGEFIFNVILKIGVKSHVIETPNGWQFFFLDTKKVPRQQAKTLSKGGIILDYRLAGKGYIVLPGEYTEGREWRQYELNGEVDPLPIWLEPLKTPKTDDVIPIPIPVGVRNDTLFRHTCRLRDFIKSEVEIEEIITFMNEYLTEEPLPKNELWTVIKPREGYEYGLESQKREKRGELTKEQNIEEVLKSIKVYSASEILSMELPEPSYLVEDLLPEGVTILAGRPKSGKSWTALNIAVAVATGGKALGKLQAKKGKVLYLALEDNTRRIQERLDIVLQGEQHIEGLDVILEIPRDYWLDFLRTLEGYSLIILDTLARVKKSSKNQNIYEADYEAITPIKHLSDQKGVSFLIVHHTKKKDEEDPLYMVSGSTGLTGAADTILVLNKSNKSLYIVGRDIEEKNYSIKFDENIMSWIVEGDYEEVKRSNERKEILAVLEEIGAEMNAKQIAEITGKNYNTTRNLLRKMAEAGELERVGRGLYKLPSF